jgi:hypothetical protein
MEDIKVVYTDQNQPRVQYGHCDYVEQASPYSMIKIVDEDSEQSILVYKEDIPNLIKALQEAQELFGE